MVMEPQIKKKIRILLLCFSHRLFLSHLKGKSSQDGSRVKQSANLCLFCGNANEAKSHHIEPTACKNICPLT